eukprot:3416728-Prymnesium_polylepis.1
MDMMETKLKWTMKPKIDGPGSRDASPPRRAARCLRRRDRAREARPESENVGHDALGVGRRVAHCKVVRGHELRAARLPPVRDCANAA